MSEDILASLSAREDNLARREEDLTRREQEIDAEVIGIQGRCRLLQKKVTHLIREGMPQASELMASLPHVAPPPGVANRNSAVLIRRRAIASREAATMDRERALAFLDQALGDAKQKLAQIQTDVNSLNEQLATRTTPAASTPPQPAPPERPAQAPDTRRAQKRTRLDCQVNLGTETNFFSGFARDVSEGGLFVATFDLLPIGSEVDVSFSLPGGIKLSTTAVVRWVRELSLAESEAGVWPGLGLQFINLDDEQRRRIDEFMGRREPIFFVD